MNNEATAIWLDASRYLSDTVRVHLDPEVGHVAELIVLARCTLLSTNGSHRAVAFNACNGVTDRDSLSARASHLRSVRGTL